MCELQAMFPTHWDHMGYETNPLDIACDPNPLRQHLAGDPVVVDLVSKGLGVIGSKRSPNPQILADARAALSWHQKGWLWVQGGESN